MAVQEPGEELAEKYKFSCPFLSFYHVGVGSQGLFVTNITGTSFVLCRYSTVYVTGVLNSAHGRGGGVAIAISDSSDLGNNDKLCVSCIDRHLIENGKGYKGIRPVF